MANTPTGQPPQTKLRERIKARGRVRQRALQTAEVDRIYQKLVSRLSQFEQEEDRQIHIRLSAYSEISERIFEDEESDGTEPSTEPQPRFHRALRRRPLPKPTDPSTAQSTLPDAVVRRIRKAAQEDRRNNVLYQLWMETRLKRGPLDLELEEFSEAVAGRALVRLLALVPNGAKLLCSVSDDPDPNWVPDVMLVRRFVEHGGLAEEDNQRFLARLFQEVPQSRRALYRLLGAYKLVVRLQHDRDGTSMTGELPGEDYGQELVTWDQLSRLLGMPPTAFERAYHEDASLSRAVSRYLAGDSLMAAAEAGPVSRGQLRRRLKELKLLRGRGRQSKALRLRQDQERVVR